MNYQNNPLVSIVMGVYNGERFLKQQIESILNQTYANFELLILDDHSTDSSELIIDHYLKSDSRIRYFKNDINIGFNRNFEKGIRLCQGDLVMISDQDDIWLDFKITELVRNFDSASLLIYSNSDLIDEHGQKLNRQLDNQINHPDNPTFKSFLAENFVTGHTCMFKKELLNYALPFPETIYFYDWWLGFTAAYVGKVKYLDRSLTLYRIHEKSVMKKAIGPLSSKTERSQKKLLQVAGFSSAQFLSPADKEFVQSYFNVKSTASKGFLNFSKCYWLLFKNRSKIFPWYNKSAVKKLNFIRKQCLE